MREKINQVIAWGSARGLHDTDDLKPQLVKLTEELGEIAAGVARDNNHRIIDGVGDLLVVLINFGAVFCNRYSKETHSDFTADFLDICLEKALAEIRDRTGKTVEGVFVKDE